MFRPMAKTRNDGDEKYSSCKDRIGAKTPSRMLTLGLMRLRRFRIFCVVLFAGCSMTLLQLLAETQSAVDGAYENQSSVRLLKPEGYDRDQACQFPILDPFDPSILTYVKHPDPIFCQRVQPELTWVDGDWMKVDAALASRHRFKEVFYRQILRKNETHNVHGNWTAWNFTESPAIYLLDPVEVYGRYVFDHKDSKVPPKRYRNVHASIHVKYKAAPDGNDWTRPVNVLIFGIDSTSRSNFIRNLPKTYSVLTERMNSTVFRGYNKIDDNTFPNILAIVTGHRVSIHGSELRGHFQKDYVDHYPFIWKNFSEVGYVTGLAEEQPGVLSYKAKGFEHPPTDWYLRPFGVELENSPLRKHSSPFCVGNQAESKIILDAISRFLMARHESGIPYFLFSFLWKISHDKTNDIEMIDHLIADFFKKLYDGGYFNNTLIFVMGDHGNRFDNIRRTLIGRYEERMPYLSVFMPSWFQEQHRSAVQNLNSNAWRLTCQYDIYETLVDVVSRQYGDETRETFKNRGRSLFSPIPKTRTCEDAHIGSHYCVCQKDESLDVETPVVRSAAVYALDQINNRYLGHVRTLCSKLSLKRLISAQKYKANDNVKYAVRWHFDKLLTERKVTDVVSHLRVTFATTPNEGVYEALVQYYEPAKGFDETSDALNATSADISRINAYGNDGDCVSKIDRNLEKFCYCGKKLWFL